MQPCECCATFAALNSDWSEALVTDLAVLTAKPISYRLVGPINFIDWLSGLDR